MAQIESPDNSASDLKNQVAALERQVFYLLLALIVVSGTMTMYLYRQTSMLGKEIQVVKPQADKVRGIITENRPAIQGFLNQLGDYALHHPDFQKQIMTPNGFPPAGTAAAPASDK